MYGLIEIAKQQTKETKVDPSITNPRFFRIRGEKDFGVWCMIDDKEGWFYNGNGTDIQPLKINPVTDRNPIFVTWEIADPLDVIAYFQQRKLVRFERHLRATLSMGGEIGAFTFMRVVKAMANKDDCVRPDRADSLWEAYAIMHTLLMDGIDAANERLERY